LRFGASRRTIARCRHRFPQRPHPTSTLVEGKGGALAVKRAIASARPDVVEQMLAIVARYADEESKRESTIESKASWLLGSSSAFSALLIGSMVSNATIVAARFAAMSSGRVTCLKVALGIAIASALGSLVTAFDAMRSRVSAGRLDPSTIFRSDVGPSWKADGDTLTGYRRFVIASMWEQIETTTKTADEKARSLRWAQRALLAFAVSVMFAASLFIAR